MKTLNMVYLCTSFDIGTVDEGKYDVSVEHRISFAFSGFLLFFSKQAKKYRLNIF